MTTAQLVNLILDKLRTGRVEFLVISNRPTAAVRFKYGEMTYTALHNENWVEVYKWENGSKVVSVCDNYQAWMDGVLNGKTRNEEGVLA